MVEYTRRAVLGAVGAGLTMSAGAGVAGAQDEYEADEGARVVHLSPDAPAVDVYIDDEVAYEGVEPFATQSDYLSYEPGEYTVSFVPTGGDLEEAVLETDVHLESGEYTLAALGEVCSTSGRSLQIRQFEDDNSPTGAGNARIRAIHASPDAPAVDVSIEGERAIEGLEFGEGDYTEIPAGETIVGIHEVGDDDPLARFRIEPEAGSVYSGFGVGYLEPENAPEAAPDIPFSLAIAEDAAPGEQ
ncbi:DUF4397 domain-containing protein [Halalkalicoccus subterraneus]|uniref:DUF4397 domain-containing protein n=1 Tax=Halalkalicoccus subterraneus TaxID=2675002 RepID=UPI000EFCF377|nr:DUF4397 domain-containing protein [Halalkalicoccus subterraneus]